MNNTKNTLNKSTLDCSDVEKKLHNLNIMLLGLNAYGSLQLTDLQLIEDYLKGAFNFSLPVNEDDE